MVSASHDKSLRLWERTREPLVLEEEREMVRIVSFVPKTTVFSLFFTVEESGSTLGRFLTANHSLVSRCLGLTGTFCTMGLLP